MTLPRGVQMGMQCAVHKHRELVPLHTHHVHPLGEGGEDVKGNEVIVCANGHYSVHALLDLMLKFHRQAGEPVPWIRRRMYGRKVRAMAQRGFDEIMAAR